MKTESKNISRKGMLTILILAVIFILIASVYIYIQSLMKPFDSDSDTKVSVTIEKGSGTEKIADVLEREKIISSASGFKILSRLEGNDGKYKAGVYLLSPSMTSKEIMSILIKGEQDILKLTIPEGFNLKQIADRVDEIGICTAEEFLKETREGDFTNDSISAMQQGENRMEGFLFPATYDIYKNISAHDVISMMLDKFDMEYADALNSLKNKPDYNTLEIVTIASLIENEARIDSERAIISSVIYNRLNRGMRLKIDATVQYALGTHKSRLYNKDLQIDSPYNTYKVDGLPKGPICSPGSLSIMAAMEPSATEYIYYVASPSGDGSHNFATNEADFSRYAQEYWDSLN